MYIDINNQSYPLSEAQIGELNPNVSGPMPYPGYAWVFPAPKPEYLELTQVVREIAPVLTHKGHWEQQWEIVPRFTEYTDEAGTVYTVENQIAAAEAIRLAQLTSYIRTQRNQLLLESDWTQVADAPVDKSAWASYRQQLRNIPSQPNFPNNIVWPTIP